MIKHCIVIGIDEVGSGALAGPVVLAAVARRSRVRWATKDLGRIRDSKKLSALKRQAWFSYLTAHPGLWWRVTRVGPELVDRFNVRRAANFGAARLARFFEREGKWIKVYLDGGLFLPAQFAQKTLIKGDERMPLIAAASIIAKVWRDRLMVRLDREFPGYGLAIHKGYGTKLHQRALARYGRSPLHRKSFQISRRSSNVKAQMSK